MTLLRRRFFISTDKNISSDPGSNPGGSRIGRNPGQKDPDNFQKVLVLILFLSKW